VKMKLLRKLYDWVLHWAETPYGPIALFILAFAESSFFPIPPDALLIALVLGATSRAFMLALNCTIASVLGALLGYTIGHFLWWTPSNEFTSIAMFFFNNIPGFTEKLFFDVQKMYDKYDFWIVFTAGFTPIPYKVITISSGAFNINLLMFIVASVISRGARFFLVAFLIWKFGPQIRTFIDKYFNWLAVAFTVLLIGGFVAIKYAL
ncbi:YqaA family protein, partial [Ignavibacterium sp.]|uniref:YqaA family protein n=2 Tax=Ignavibacterium TaxID=795750 RepID=UPI0025BF366F